MVTGLTSRHQPGCTPSGGCRGACIPCLYQLRWPPALLGLEPHPPKLWAGATTGQGLVAGLASGCQEVGKRMGLLWRQGDSFQGKRDLGWGPNHCLPTLSPIRDGDPALIDWGVPELSAPGGQGPSPACPLQHPRHLAQSLALSRCSVFVDSVLPPHSVFSPCSWERRGVPGRPDG